MLLINLQNSVLDVCEKPRGNQLSQLVDFVECPGKKLGAPVKWGEGYRAAPTMSRITSTMAAISREFSLRRLDLYLASQ